jgi:hypothetical protein
VIYDEAGGNIVRKETYRERKSGLSSIQVFIHSFMQLGQHMEQGEARRKNAVVE